MLPPNIQASPLVATSSEKKNRTRQTEQSPALSDRMPLS